MSSISRIGSRNKSVSHGSVSQQRARFKQLGLSMIELMIAITIGLLLVAGITLLIARQSSTRAEFEKASRKIENGRYAMQILKDEIEHAGFYDQFTDIGPAPATLPDPCETDVTKMATALPLALQGYDSLALINSVVSCLADGNHKPGTDMLVVRHADLTAPIAVASAVAGQPYIQTGQTGPGSAIASVIGSGPNTALFKLQDKSGNIASLRKYIVRLYFISPCNTPAGAACTASDDAGNPTPTLKRLDLGVNAAGATAFSMVPLAEGIENLQLDYGLDSAAADGSPHTYTTAPATSADWSNVMAIRVNILARNNEATGGYSDKKAYNLGLAGAIPAYNDAYKRHVFTELVRAINPSGRREQ